MSNSIIVAGIGTEVGKTVVSTILCEALNADYWKPIQAGDLEQSDTLFVTDHLHHQKTFKAWPEAHRLSHAMSPHAAADLDGKEILLDDVELPTTDNPLVIELAGGLMVPLSASVSTVDLIQKLQSRLY